METTTQKGPNAVPNGAQVVWFKRDLRVADHRPLAEAAKRGPCVCLYVYEPELIEAEDFDPAHLAFINQSLESLQGALRALGADLTVRTGSMPDVLDQLHHEIGVVGLWSHQETSNGISYARDRRIEAWARRASVTWTQFPGHGVVRGLASRDGWAARWNAHVTLPVTPAPNTVRTVAGVQSDGLRSHAALGLEPSARTRAQTGGIDPAQQTLESFLRQRGVNYRRDMSSPGPAWTGCSRLSPYLAWGNVSIRQVYQHTRRRVEDLAGERRRGHEVDPRWRASLSAFEQRLRWHCHFIQKLEDEPEIEFRNMSRAYDGLREDEFDGARFDAWRTGRTGYPMVDACMRALHHSGWINFRMRAMLMSFASYHLWLHWRPTALHLARQFLDYEPGIHYSQTQMQSGVTGINAIRIYSPIKQVTDHDPAGEFVRAYCPELAQVPNEFIAEPHKMPTSVQRASGCVVGKHYPAPIVEHKAAYQQARARIYAVKASASAREAAGQVYAKHGSRRRPPQRRGRRA